MNIKFSNNLKKNYIPKYGHGFHLVDISPWPFITAMSAFILMSGTVMYLHTIKLGNFVMTLGLVLVILSMTIWWRDVIREATFEGHHTKIVQKGLRLGMILFIISEVMFFFAFFWAFFHSSLAPTIELGSIWPPYAIEPFNPLEVPLLNTMILLTSGATVTWCHHAITTGKKLRKDAIISLIYTILLAIIFTLLQLYEYNVSQFDISDGIYGSTFFMTTGFHGFHVIIGTIFLTVCLIRLIKHHFTSSHHFGFEAAAWYWHFVDVVWLFLYVSVYYWAVYDLIVYDSVIDDLDDIVDSIGDAASGDPNIVTQIIVYVWKTIVWILTDVIDLE